MEVSYKKQRDIVEGEVAERQDRGDMLARGETSLNVGISFLAWCPGQTFAGVCLLIVRVDFGNFAQHPIGSCCLETDFITTFDHSVVHHLLLLTCSIFMSDHGGVTYDH